METITNSRRTQFSSCDTCRQARVACDASRNGNQHGETQGTGSCTRCALKKRNCTFEWLKDVKKTPLDLHRNSKSQKVLTTSTSFILWEPPEQVNLSTVTSGEHPNRIPENISSNIKENPRPPPYKPFPLELESDSSHFLSSKTESARVLFIQWSDQIFHRGFGTTFGYFIGKNGCPLVKKPSIEVNLPPTELFGELDYLMDEQLSRESRGHTCQTTKRESDRNYEIDQSLRLTIQSYVARWLLAVAQDSAVDNGQFEEIVRVSWRAARKDMLKVINRVSYRSVLTLYLFGQTPVPVGISEEEELDGISGLICTQTSLLQLQQLRGRLRNCQYGGSEVSAWPNAMANLDSSPHLNPRFLDLESRAYWAAMTWDTSTSVTLNIRSTISTGLRGACLEPSWILTRGFLVDYFYPKSKEWREETFQVSNEVASEIISATGICRLYVWRTIASLKEALTEGVDEEGLLFAWRALLDALDVFKTAIRPLLENCEIFLGSLSQINRLNWYTTILHYYLGILILVDAVEAAHRIDLLPQLIEPKLEAEYECLKVLRLGLENTCTMNSPQEDLRSASNFDYSTYLPERPTGTTSFVAIDPYPHHVIASVQLMNKSVSRDYRQGKIKHEVYAQLLSTLVETLEQLPQSSKSVCAAREHLQLSIEKLNDAQPQTE